MLDLRDVVVRYPRFTLGPIGLSLGPGERVALLGRNGAGKSTLLSLIAGNRHVEQGTIALAIDAAPDGATGEPDTRLRLRKEVAYVGAALQALPWYTVRRHFEFLSRVHQRWNAARAMDLARTLRLDLDATTGTLSRGNLVKLNLCTAWGQEASILLLDEPTAGLDPVARTDLLKELRVFIDAHPAGSVVYATHLLDELQHVQPSRVLVLIDGALREYHRQETRGFDVEVLTALMSGGKFPSLSVEVA